MQVDTGEEYMVGGVVGVFALLGMTAAIWGGVELAGRIKPMVAAVAFPAIAVVVSVAWAVQGVGTPFLFAKVISVGLSASLIVWLAQAWRGSKSTWGRWLAIIMLALNIAEAIAAELLTAVSPNVFAGLLLILTLPGPSAIAVGDRNAPNTDFRYGLSWLWVGAYTFWNLAFVYGTAAPGRPLGEFGGLALLHLGAPLLASRGDATRWAQGRTFALALTFLALPNAETPVDTQDWYHPQIAAAMGIIALLLAVATLVQRLRMRSRGQPLS